MSRPFGVVFCAAVLALLLASCRGGCRKDEPPKSVPAGRGVEAGARWKPASFGGAGNFLSVVADPRKPGVVYAASDVAGVFRSEDAGSSWRIRSLGLGNYEISSLAIDPFDSDTLYAGVGAFRAAHKAGLYVSRDAGRSWIHLPASQRHGITFRKYRTTSAIALDPRKRGALLVGSAASGLFRSVDAGRSFERVLEPPRTRAKLEMEDGQDEVEPPYPAPVAMVAFAPERDGKVYAGWFGAGVARSDADGVAGSWRWISEGLPREATVKNLVVGSGGLLFAALGKSGVYRSNDGGAHWRPASRGLALDEGWVSSVAQHPRTPSLLYATLATYDAANVWRSDDSGDSWKPLDEVRYDEKQNATRRWARDRTLTWWVTIDPSHPERLFAANFWGLQRSEDAGDSWDDAVAGALNTCVTGLALADDGALWATHMDAGIVVSRDRGESWRAVMPDHYDKALAGHYWRIIVAGSGESRRFFATLDPWDEPKGKILRSRDGQRWQVVLEVPRAKGAWMDGAMIGLAADPRDGGRTLYSVQDGGPLRVSRDGGDRWHLAEGQPGNNSFTGALAVGARGQLLAGTLQGGLWRSLDGGRHWHRVLAGHDAIWQVLPAGDALYASSGTDANLYRSLDGGKVWTRLTTAPTEQPGDEVGDQGMAIAVDPRNPKHLVFSRLDTYHSADAGSGLMESRDGGRTWQGANEDLGLPNVAALLFAPDGTLYAGTRCAGVWRREPTGGSAPTRR